MVDQEVTRPLLIVFTAYALLDDLCVLRRTCRQSSLYETLFHCNTQVKSSSRSH
jgi:hypothetical protein